MFVLLSLILTILFMCLLLLLVSVLLFLSHLDILLFAFLVEGIPLFSSLAEEHSVLHILAHHLFPHLVFNRLDEDREGCLRLLHDF